MTPTPSPAPTVYVERATDACTGVCLGGFDWAALAAVLTFLATLALLVANWKMANSAKASADSAREAAEATLAGLPVSLKASYIMGKKMKSDRKIKAGRVFLDSEGATVKIHSAIIKGIVAFNRPASEDEAQNFGNRKLHMLAGPGRSWVTLEPLQSHFPNGFPVTLNASERLQLNMNDYQLNQNQDWNELSPGGRYQVMISLNYSVGGSSQKLHRTISAVHMGQVPPPDPDTPMSVALAGR